jgi:pSer/pThr/pTyr-binding forkhead associated (FHA) protein
MGMQLTVIAGPDKGRSFEVAGGEKLQIGRSQSTQTRLVDPHVSRMHCELEVQGERVVLVDAKSAAGTFVNGKKVMQQILRHGDIIQVGDTQLLFQNDEASDQSTLPPNSLQAKPAAAAIASVESLAGQKLSRYEIGPIIAKGQSGVVFRGRDTESEQVVAFKVLRPDFSQNEQDMQRFVRAMKTVLPLRHPNLVQLYNAGRTGPYCWMAMEFVDGESLTRVIHRIGIAGMLDWRYGLRVAVHVARALDFASKHQIIHRNVEPANILIRNADKVAKLGDLMLAKALEGTLAQQITRPGELLGEIRYMAPERTRGTADIDGRSDIYGLGATVYALLTGRPPLEAGSLPDTIMKIRQAEPEKPRKYQLAIPEAFEGTVLRMLAKRPEDRHQTAADLLEDLERVAKFQGVVV